MSTRKISRRSLNLKRISEICINFFFKMANFQHFDIGDGEGNPKRFASLEASDLDELLEAAHSKRTKYSTNFAVSVYKG